MLDKIKLLLGINNTSKDYLLLHLIENATDEVRNFTHRNDICGLETEIIRIVCWQYGRLGTEGLTAENYNGASYTYAEDYPEYILRGLRSKRKIQVML